MPQSFAFVLQRDTAPAAGAMTAQSPDFSPIKHIWDNLEWESHEFERTRVKVTTNMERNVSRHHTELVRLNAPSYRIVHSR
ncbi:hypothetical protein TNCV_415291 [Trichonephila clavipes]|nr:hypothetical protein TNCV_415291 [Trichonephila clavipes]